MSRAYGMIIMDVRPKTEQGDIVHRIYRFRNGYGVSVLTNDQERSDLVVVKWFDSGSFEFLPAATPVTKAREILTGLDFAAVGEIMARVKELDDTPLAIKWALAEESEKDQ